MTDETNSAEKPTVEPAAKPAPKRPQYGEMAPEGWVNPVTGEPAVAAEAAAEATTVLSSASGPTSTATPTSKSDTSSLSGVPHNLGVSTHAPAKTASSHHGQPPAQNSSNADAPAAEVTTSQPEKTRGAKQPPRRDRIFTIILLAFGALGALNLGDAFMQLSQSAAQLYALYDIGTFTAPEWLGTASTIGWISMLSIWAVSLILSIQLIQRGKLSFYIPLAGAVLSFIVLIVIMSIVVVNGMPELMTYVQTNGFNLDKLQELQ